MPEIQLLRRQDVEALTGFSTSTLYRLMDEGKFPEPIRIGPSSNRWPIAEIKAWLESCPRGRNPQRGRPKKGAT